MNKRNTVIAGLAAAGFLALIIGLNSKPTDRPPATAQAAPQNAGPQPQWRYSTEVDAMRGTSTTLARVRGSPADGRASAAHVTWLTVLASEPTSVLLTTESGSLCSARSVVSFRIDGGPVEYGDCQHLRSSQPRGTAWLTPMAIISDASGRPIPPRLRGATEMIVEVPTFEGPIQVVFHVEGLTL